MFKTDEIKYLRLGNSGVVWIKYINEQEQILVTPGMEIDLQDYFQKQGRYYQKRIEERNDKAKNWQERHQKFLWMKSKGFI